MISPERMSSLRLRIGAVAFVLDFAVGISMIAMPLKIVALSGSAGFLGAFGSLMSLCYAASSVLFGGISDRGSRVRLLRAAPLIYGLALCVIPLLDSKWLLLAFGPALPLANGMFWPAFQGWIADVSGRQRQQHLSIFCVSWSSGLAAGFFAGGALADLNLGLSAVRGDLPFLVAAACSGAVWLLMRGERGAAIEEGDQRPDLREDQIRTGRGWL